jgi:hypothetical protein
VSALAKRFLVAGALLLSLATWSHAATFVLTPLDAYSPDNSWLPVPSGSLGDVLGEASPDASTYARTADASTSTPLFANLSGPATAPASGSTYTLLVIARSEAAGNGSLRVELWSDGAYVTSIGLSGGEDDALLSEFHLVTHTLSAAEVGNLADPWALSLVITAGNLQFGSSVDLAWSALSIEEP